MKKSALLFILPALALASCSSDETVNAPDAPGINFSAAVSNGSRAATTTSATIRDFKVTAMSDALPNLVYFKDFLVQRNGSAWNGNGKYMWPHEELKFCAYSPANAPLTTTQNRSGLEMGLKDFTVSSNISDQIDLLVAQNSMKNDWIRKSVGLYFDHALSKVRFSAICSNEIMKVEVYGVKIGYINSKGNFTYPNNDGNNILNLNQTTADRVWTNLTSPKDLVMELDRPVTIQGQDYGTTLNPSKISGTSIMNDADDCFMIIPQHLRASGAWTKGDRLDGAYIGVKCKIYVRKSDGDYSTLYWPTSGQPEYACTPLATDFDPSKTYNIILNLAGGGLTDPINPPIKPIIKEYIDYSVTVSDWAAQTGSIVSMDK